MTSQVFRLSSIFRPPFSGLRRPGAIISGPRRRPLLRRAHGPPTAFSDLRSGGAFFSSATRSLAQVFLEAQRRSMDDIYYPENAKGFGGLSIRRRPFFSGAYGANVSAGTVFSGLRRGGAFSSGTSHLGPIFAAPHGPPTAFSDLRSGGAFFSSATRSLAQEFLEAQRRAMNDIYYPEKAQGFGGLSSRRRPFFSGAYGANVSPGTVFSGLRRGSSHLGPMFTAAQGHPFAFSGIRSDGAFFSSDCYSRIEVLLEARRRYGDNINRMLSLDEVIVPKEEFRVGVVEDLYLCWCIKSGVKQDKLVKYMMFESLMLKR